MGTQAQDAYAQVSRLEGELNHVMDDIPAAALESERTRDALRQAAGKLEEVVRLLEGVREEEAPRYERSPMANQVG
jgi:hypothetical protein